VREQQHGGCERAVVRQPGARGPPALAAASGV
jgi:hypothetical protein